MKYFVRLIQMILIATPFLLFGWLCVENFVPSGSFIVRHSVHDSSPFIDALQTSERVTTVAKDSAGIWTQKIIADPVFFFVHPFTVFDSVDATVWFKNHGAPIVELGALAAKDPERYVLQPLQNLLIDESKWQRIEGIGQNEQGLVLLQRTPKFKTVEDFLKNPPPLNEIATYNTSVDSPFRLANYVASANTQSINTSFRGALQLKTYVKNESLHFTFAYMDMNRDAGADPIVISVFDENGNGVGEVRTDDDGNVSTNAFPSAMKTITIDIPNLPEGVYKLDVNADRDIFVRTISTTQQKLIFLNDVYLGDEDGYKQTFSPVTFFTEAKRLSFQTRHATGVQQIHVGSQTVSIDQPYKLVTTDLVDAGLVASTIKKGDVEIVTDAPITFSQAQYFRPDPVRLLPHTDLDKLGINYLLAKYTSPTVVDGWTVATIHLNAHDLLLDNGSWKFTFSTPEIAELKSSVEVKEIDLKFSRPQMTWYTQLLQWMHKL